MRVPPQHRPMYLALAGSARAALVILPPTFTGVRMARWAAVVGSGSTPRFTICHSDHTSTAEHVSKDHATKVASRVQGVRRRGSGSGSSSMLDMGGGHGGGGGSSDGQGGQGGGGCGWSAGHSDCPAEERTLRNARIPLASEVTAKCPLTAVCPDWCKKLALITLRNARSNSWMKY